MEMEKTWVDELEKQKLALEIQLLEQRVSDKIENFNVFMNISIITYIETRSSGSSTVCVRMGVT